MIRDRLARQSRRGLRDLGRIAYCAFRNGGGAMRAHLLTTTAAAALLAAMPARAQDATWSTAPANSDFNTAANWTPATVPTGTAFFGMSTITGLTFNTGASQRDRNAGPARHRSRPFDEGTSGQCEVGL
jgi:hypothetical protein